MHGIKSFLKNFFLVLTPISILKIIFHKRLPNVNTKIYYVKGINSDKALKVLSKEGPDAVILFNCGLIGKRMCNTFHNVLLNAHAGKLPEFRGMNNVEWAYLEDVPLVGTIHYMVYEIDAGDIVLEQQLKKEKHPKSIDEIRNRAFDQVYDLIPKALQTMQEDGFKPIKQSNVRTTRYVMHPFLKRMLEKKLKIDKK